MSSRNTSTQSVASFGRTVRSASLDFLKMTRSISLLKSSQNWHPRFDYSVVLQVSHFETGREWTKSCRRGIQSTLFEWWVSRSSEHSWCKSSNWWKSDLHLSLSVCFGLKEIYFASTQWINSRLDRRNALSKWFSGILSDELWCTKGYGASHRWFLFRTSRLEAELSHH